MNWTIVTDYLAANWIELAGFVTTAAGIWLTTKRWLACWPVVLAADIFYLIVFFQAHLYSDTLLQVFFIAFTFYGWWNWWRGVREEGDVRIEPLSMQAVAIGILMGAAASAALGWQMTRLHASLPYLDAALTSFSLLASWWQARKNIANWWAWIAIDGIYIGEYAWKRLWLTSVLSVLLVALAILGLRDWRRAEIAQTAN